MEKYRKNHHFINSRQDISAGFVILACFGTKYKQLGEAEIKKKNSGLVACPEILNLQTKVDTLYPKTLEPTVFNFVV